MSTCTTCGHGLSRDRSLWTTCQACQDRIAAHLADVEATWPLLAGVLKPAGTPGARVSGSATPSLPVAGQLLNLIGPMGVPGRLYFRYADLALARHIQPARKPPGDDAVVRLALYGIRKHLPWAVQGLDLTELERVLDGIVRDLRGATSTVDTPTVPCPAELPDKTRCTGKMRYDRERGTAYCRTCRTDLDPAEWLEYWVRLGQPA